MPSPSFRLEPSSYHQLSKDLRGGQPLGVFLYAGTTCRYISVGEFRDNPAKYAEHTLLPPETIRQLLHKQLEEGKGLERLHAATIIRELAHRSGDDKVVLTARKFFRPSDLPIAEEFLLNHREKQLERFEYQKLPSDLLDLYVAICVEEHAFNRDQPPVELDLAEDATPEEAGKATRAFLEASRTQAHYDHQLIDEVLPYYLVNLTDPTHISSAQGTLLRIASENYASLKIAIKKHLVTKLCEDKDFDFLEWQSLVLTDDVINQFGLTPDDFSEVLSQWVLRDLGDNLEKDGIAGAFDKLDLSPKVVQALEMFTRPVFNPPDLDKIHYNLTSSLAKGIFERLMDHWEKKALGPAPEEGPTFEVLEKQFKEAIDLFEEKAGQATNPTVGAVFTRLQWHCLGYFHNELHTDTEKASQKVLANLTLQGETDPAAYEGAIQNHGLTVTGEYNEFLAGVARTLFCGDPSQAMSREELETFMNKWLSYGRLPGPAKLLWEHIVPAAVKAQTIPVVHSPQHAANITLFLRRALAARVCDPRFLLPFMSPLLKTNPLVGETSFYQQLLNDMFPHPANVVDTPEHRELAEALPSLTFELLSKDLKKASPKQLLHLMRVPPVAACFHQMEQIEKHLQHKIPALAADKLVAMDPETRLSHIGSMDTYLHNSRGFLTPNQRLCCAKAILNGIECRRDGEPIYSAYFIIVKIIAKYLDRQEWAAAMVSLIRDYIRESPAPKTAADWRRDAIKTYRTISLLDALPISSYLESKGQLQSTLDQLFSRAERALQHPSIMAYETERDHPIELFTAFFWGLPSNSSPPSPEKRYPQYGERLASARIQLMKKFEPVLEKSRTLRDRTFNTIAKAGLRRLNIQARFLDTLLKDDLPGAIELLDFINQCNVEDLISDALRSPEPFDADAFAKALERPAQQAVNDLAGRIPPRVRSGFQRRFTPKPDRALIEELERRWKDGTLEPYLPKATAMVWETDPSPPTRSAYFGFGIRVQPSRQDASQPGPTEVVKNLNRLCFRLVVESKGLGVSGAGFTWLEGYLQELESLPKEERHDLVSGYGWEAIAGIYLRNRINKMKTVYVGLPSTLAPSFRAVTLAFLDCRFPLLRDDKVSVDHCTTLSKLLDRTTLRCITEKKDPWVKGFLERYCLLLPRDSTTDPPEAGKRFEEAFDMVAHIHPNNRSYWVDKVWSSFCAWLINRPALAEQTGSLADFVLEMENLPDGVRKWPLADEQQWGPLLRFLQASYRDLPLVLPAAIKACLSRYPSQLKIYAQLKELMPGFYEYLLRFAVRPNVTVRDAIVGEVLNFIDSPEFLNLEPEELITRLGQLPPDIQDSLPSSLLAAKTAKQSLVPEIERRLLNGLEETDPLEGLSTAMSALPSFLVESYFYCEDKPFETPVWKKVMEHLTVRIPPLLKEGRWDAVGALLSQVPQDLLIAYSTRVLPQGDVILRMWWKFYTHTSTFPLEQSLKIVEAMPTKLWRERARYIYGRIGPSFRVLERAEDVETLIHLSPDQLDLYMETQIAAGGLRRSFTHITESAPYLPKLPEKVPEHPFKELENIFEEFARDKRNHPLLHSMARSTKLSVVKEADFERYRIGLGKLVSFLEGRTQFSPADNRLRAEDTFLQPVHLMTRATIDQLKNEAIPFKNKAKALAFLAESGYRCAGGNFKALYDSYDALMSEMDIRDVPLVEALHRHFERVRYSAIEVMAAEAVSGTRLDPVHTVFNFLKTLGDKTGIRLVKLLTYEDHYAGAGAQKPIEELRSLFGRAYDAERMIASVMENARLLGIQRAWEKDPEKFTPEWVKAEWNQMSQDEKDFTECADAAEYFREYKVAGSGKSVGYVALALWHLGFLTPPW